MNLKINIVKFLGLLLKACKNKVVHDYGSIKMTIVYDIVTNGIPFMYEQLIKIK